MAYSWKHFDRSESRFTDQAVFVVTVPMLEPGGRLSDEQVSEVAAEARGEGDVTITPIGVSYGWGAGDAAVGLLLDLAVGFTPAIVAAVWMRIRHRRPIMSVGALRYLCMGDLAQRLQVDSLDDLVDVVACDAGVARSAEPYGELMDIGPVLVVFTDRANARSWVYLVSPRGHILSFHEGGPITAGSPYDMPAQEPPLLLPNDGPGDSSDEQTAT